jgi:hypothetical protein
MAPLLIQGPDAFTVQLALTRFSSGWRAHRRRVSRPLDTPQRTDLVLARPRIRLAMANPIRCGWIHTWRPVRHRLDLSPIKPAGPVGLLD